MNEKLILIVEDDLGIIDVLSIVLNVNNYKYIIVSQSNKAQKIIKERKPSLIIMDLWMPTLTGDALTNRLKQDTETMNIPIIIISASSNLKDIATKAGADDYLPKPFDIEDLEKIIKKYI
jgi:DNA-binding response OmpR family regulator